MTKPLLTIDDLLVLLYRTNTTLFTLAIAQQEPAGQFNESLHQPKPLDYIMRLDVTDAPVALKIGRLIATLPATESGSVCHTVMLLDGTVTTWRGQCVVNIPAAVSHTSL
ncbi:MAG: hypothetical protein IT327_06185 [Anaerolineae bacterium]|nr:hypothetical protein [Anaerolineae bacterium]